MHIEDLAAQLKPFPALFDLPERLTLTPAAADRRKLIAVRGVQGMNADGCTYYRLQGSELFFEIVLSRSLELGGAEYGARNVDFPSIRMRRFDGSIDDDSLAVKAVVQRKTLHVADVTAELGAEAHRTQGFDRLMDYHTHSILTVPVMRDEKVFGVLQFINANDAERQAVPFDAQRIALGETLARLMANAQD